MAVFLKVPEAGCDCVTDGDALFNGIAFPEGNSFDLVNASHDTFPGCPQIHRFSSGGFLKRFIAMKLQYPDAFNRPLELLPLWECA